MNKENIALNLLAEKTCDNCRFASKAMNMVRCIKGGIASFCPEEFTCENWKEQEIKRPHLILGKAKATIIKK